MVLVFNTFPDAVPTIGKLRSTAYVDCWRSRIRSVATEDEKSRVPGWVQFIHDNEPRTIAFHEYRSADGAEVADPPRHRLVRAPHARARRALRSLLQGNPWGTTDIRIYGQPTDAILEMLKETAGSGVPVTILPEHFGGFTRS
jgi:hypothetical protein